MPRYLKRERPYIQLFYEGESEQAYSQFLKEEFKNVAVIKCPSFFGLFDEADNKYKKDKKFKSAAEETNEIWFFFDLETKDISKWESRLKIIKRLRRMRKPNIKVRLLMTSGCIEYWLMLHYEYVSPSVRTKAEKETIIKGIIEKEPTYEKGDYDSTQKIAEKYLVAVENAKKIIMNLLQDGLPGIEETDERDEWICKKCPTISTVFEAIEYLEHLNQKRK